MKRLLFISFVFSLFLLIVFSACNSTDSNDSESAYVDLGLSVKWATMNVGADVPDGYGDFYDYDEAVSKFGNNLPTKEQLQELEDKCTWKWATRNEVNGWEVTGPNGESIFLPAAGLRGCFGLVRYVGTRGTYWSSTPYDSDNACYLYFNASEVDMYDYDRCFGRSVRLVQN